MNDRDFDRRLKASRERWRPFNEWKDKIDERVRRLEVRTNLTLARSAYLKAQAEMRAWQGAAAGRQVEAATRPAADEPKEGHEKGGRQRRRGSVGQVNKQ